ncbi:MAG: SLBB domain-containing protein [Pseudomonadota bacterium]
MKNFLPIYKLFLLVSLLNILSLFIITLNHVHAGDVIPILDSLSLVQQKNYMQASPNGQDYSRENEQLITAVVRPNNKIAEAIVPSEIEKNVTKKLTPISLEEKVHKQLIQPSLEQFGYDLFNKTPSNLSAMTNIPIPLDYIVGPGDTIVIQLYGKTNVEYRLIVTREGNIQVPELGPIIVSGIKFYQVKNNLSSLFEKQIFGVKASITLTELRTINVMVVGDVNNPGTYTVSGLTNLMDVLLISGGIKRTGSLRKIELKRQGKIISYFDLYQVLLHGNTLSNIRLVHGDVIFVPAIGATVAVGGEVQRPGIYEIKSKKTLHNIIKLAGGLLPTASIQSSHIERIKNAKYRTLVSLNLAENISSKMIIQSGDIIRILPVQNRIDDVVLLSGHYIQPGAYQFKKGMRLSKLLPSFKKLRQNADTQFALLRRELRELRRIETQYIELNKVVNEPGSIDDIQLRPRDEIIFFNLAENRARRLSQIVHDLQIQSTSSHLPMVFTINGHVKNSGTFPLQYASRLLDIFKVAGSIKAGTSLNYALIARKIFPSNKLEIFSVNLNKARQQPLTEWNPIIHPEDTITLFSSTSNRQQLIKSQINQLKTQTPYGEQSPVISISGSVNNPGDYPLEPGMRLNQLIEAAGGLNEKSYGVHAELTRYKIIDGQTQISGHQQINLLSILQNETDLLSRKYRQSSNLILEAHDYITIHQKPNSQTKKFITLAGHVKFPGIYPFENNESLCNVIHRAGGLISTAYPFGAVFSRKSIQKKQQKSLNEIQGKMDDLLVKLHLSPSINNNDKMPSNEEMHEINSVIKKLKQAKASGRMVIDLKNNLLCHRQVAQQTNIFLEDGDKLLVPGLAYEVSVFGEVYQTSTHNYDQNKGSQDYINLSGGTTDLGKNSHAYIVQANGEVMSVREDGFFSSFSNIAVKPGASIYVPINMDRSNNRETLQSWATILFRLTLSAAGIAALL